MRLDESAGYDLMLIDPMTWIKGDYDHQNCLTYFLISYFIGHANIDVYRAHFGIKLYPATKPGQ